jgi:REP element-mobilizing transposase RayT
VAKEKGDQDRMSISEKLRMDGKDYSAPGYYFVTLCTEERRRLFGRLAGEQIALSEFGHAVAQCWADIPAHFPNVEAGVFQVMPDHFHGIVRIREWPKDILAVPLKGVVAAQPKEKTKDILARGTKHGSLGSIIKGFKIGVTKMAKSFSSLNVPIFQENYYDVICFDEQELAIKEAYIKANPQRLALKSVPRGIIKQSNYIGNVELLKASPKRALRVSRKATAEEVDRAKISFGCSCKGVTVSTFFSPGERAVLDALLSHQNSRIIWIMPMGMPAQIPVKWGKALLEQRALWLSAYPDEMADATRESCIQCNEWAQRLERPKDILTIPTPS